MTSHWIEIIISLLISMACSMLLLPIVLKTAMRRHVCDAPGGRRHHNGVVPRLGGIAFLPSFILTMTAVTLTDSWLGISNIAGLLPDSMYSTSAILLSLLMIYFIGLYDDFNGARYRSKFLVQLICAALLISSGISIDSLYGVLGIGLLPPLLSWIFTTVIIVFVANAINLIDGIDGLATSLFQLTMLIYGIAFYLTAQWGCVVLCVTGIGVTTPFLRYNIIGKAAKGNKLFMGDCGSLTLGMITVILGIRLLNVLSEIDTLRGVNPAILVLAPIMIPCFDVVRVYFLRLRQHRSPFLPDRNHIHHRLLDMGFSPTATLVILILVAMILSLANIFLSTLINVNILLLFDIIFWITVTHLIRSSRPLLARILNLNTQNVKN